MNFASDGPRINVRFWVRTASVQSQALERTDVVAVAVQHTLSLQKVHRVVRLRHVDVCLPLQALKDDVTSGVLGDGVVAAVVR